ncbi:unnamed protein product [Orchesella dallaii]|uniref:UBC core domain-containing protein n=1 Tax=Orchesella dallaii TaxID=48710 RepID=A0ABP1RR52_9HEXA
MTMAVANIAAQRIKREIREIMKDDEVERCGVKVQVNEQNWLELRGEINGPPETPYAGGRFMLEILIPETYPFSPPKIKFLTKIWHPNISSVTGAVCVDILKDQWAAAMTLRTVLLSLQALMAAPEPDDPQDAVVATQFKDSHDDFLTTAQHWTGIYADGPKINEEFETMVKTIERMGISENIARARLSQANWDYNRAVTLCFN